MDKIEPGLFVKLGITHNTRSGERFWGVVQELTKVGVVVKVQQELLLSKEHGVKNGDLLLVQRRNVFAIRDRDGGPIWEP